MSGPFIGLISGTSRDGIDAVCVEFGERSLKLHAAIMHPYPAGLAQDLERLLSTPDAVSLDAIGELHAFIGECFADAALAVAAEAGISMQDIAAIGSHGQTVRHAPDAGHRFSLQLGCGARIAGRTGCQTVTDFRAGDIAAGGQGAPLVPPFHRWLFGNGADRLAIANIGGIANVTIIEDGEVVAGFDTGPGNTLMDAWIGAQQAKDYDADGTWAASADADRALVDRWKADEYFSRPAPKSTGFETFNLDWLEVPAGVDAAVVQASLLALTAETLADAVGGCRRLLVCGGGAHNSALMRALRKALPDCEVATTEVAGLHPDWVEACAFAWLAQQRLLDQPGNLPAVTGASRSVTLGAVY